MTIIGNIGLAEYHYRLIFQTLISFALYPKPYTLGKKPNGEEVVTDNGQTW